MIGNQMAYTLALLLSVALPIVLRKRKGLRIICVMTILLCSLAAVHFGLRLAARNVPMPSSKQLRSEVVYSEAWSEGRMSTQQKIDGYLPTVSFFFVILAVFGLVPLESKLGKTGDSLDIPTLHR